MKSLKLCNWKLALFALGVLVCATPVILSSCSSTAEETVSDHTASGHFVDYVDNNNEDHFSSQNFSIDGNNITEYPTSSSTYDDHIDYFYGGRLIFKFDREYQHTIYSLWVSDKYITADDAKNSALPPRSASIYFSYGGANNDYCIYSTISRFLPNSSTIEANSPITMYITLLKMTSSTNISYSVYNVIEFTYKRDNSRGVVNIPSWT